MVWIYWALILVGAYLLGSVPFAILVVKWKTGIDLRTVGSGNPGSTNAVRAGGFGAGVLVFFCDGVKAALPALIGLLVGGETLGVLAGLFAFLGHLYPVWSHFHGGKGAATSLGIALVLTPALGGISFGVWLLLALGSGYVSLGSCVASLTLSLLALFTRQPYMLTLVYFILSALLLSRHKGNIQRLMNGTESRFFRKHK